ncbi:hypothetical protein GOBAR_DD00265 [Gossypium barbadense]|nr:hypothetical protein GOBAR_DD00265 [Gossypium barbadense]
MAISMVKDELPGTLHELYEEGKYFIEKCFVKDPKKQWTFEGSSIYVPPSPKSLTSAASPSVALCCISVSIPLLLRLVYKVWMLICDLLYICLLIVGNAGKVEKKVLLLTRRREKCLVVAAVRFVRTILTHHHLKSFGRAFLTTTLVAGIDSTIQFTISKSNYWVLANFLISNYDEGWYVVLHNSPRDLLDMGNGNKMPRRRLRDLSIVQNPPNSAETNSEQQTAIGSS